MKIYRPVRTNRITQKFGANDACAKIVGGRYKVVSAKNNLCPVGYSRFYPLIGLRGHNGQDNKTYHGEPLFFPVDIPGMEWYADTEVDPDGGIGVDVISRRPIELQGFTAHVKFRFWHLKSVAVYDGKPVKLGDLLGYCDSTGASSGDHLHWAMKRCDDEGNTFNTANGYSGAVDFSPWHEPYKDTFVLTHIGEQKQLATLQHEFNKVKAAFEKVFGFKPNV